MVGHYWLRASDLAPNAEIKGDIDKAIEEIHRFTEKVHLAQLQGSDGPFQNLLLIGIGGSALGPQFVAHALGQPSKDRLTPWFLDNTDPDGMDRVFEQLRSQLGRTLCLVVSKSGGTKETRNGMLETEAAYSRAGLSFARHAAAITGVGSQLDRLARDQGWLHRFPMWDWVGGRTSVTSAVGLLPAALQGVDIRPFLEGCRSCDVVTRQEEPWANPAMLLALAWYYIGNGHGQRDMVILPYKDRLELFSRYLQQLVMESLGKELDREGKVVHQGLTVYGNKGSTDQHAYIQQLRDGLLNFFAFFIEVLHDRDGSNLEVDERTTSGDYLFGFYMGTRQALYEKGRESITLTVERISPFHVGSLIALFERAVGFYASLININAYHQPGVEAGKKAASNILGLQNKILACLEKQAGVELTADQIGAAIGEPDAAEVIYKVCRHLAANRNAGVRRGTDPKETTFHLETSA